jgi:inorganic pyrophosphatase/exopolyphosphatase
MLLGLAMGCSQQTVTDEPVKEEDASTVQEADVNEVEGNEITDSETTDSGVSTEELIETDMEVFDLKPEMIHVNLTEEEISMGIFYKKESHYDVKMQMQQPYYRGFVHQRLVTEIQLPMVDFNENIVITESQLLNLVSVLHSEYDRVIPNESLLINN